MATKPLPSPELLRQLLRYDPETGKLFWRFRDKNLEPDDRVRKHFNTIYGGKEGFTARIAGYPVTCFKGKILRAHRVIWCMLHGYWPDHIDHKNRIRHDNRIDNLIEAGREINARNCKLGKRNKSGRIGVWKDNNKGFWRSKIRFDGKYIDLGRFSSFEDACAARSAAEIKYGYSPIHGKSSRYQAK